MAAPPPSAGAPALPRSTPAAADVASTGVSAFLDVLEAAPDVELHSLMLLRHGQVVAEGWWAPYGPDQVQLLYSLSKSFTSTAAGLAAGEGLLSFDDPVVAYFPELAAAARSPWSRSMRVSDLATMATGHRADTIDRIVDADPAEPVRAFLGLAPDAAPGSMFTYNNGATYVLGAIVQRVTGQRLSSYLGPRLLDPLGIPVPAWHTFPEGRELGFSGLHLTTEAVARFGQLYLDDGRWRGERLLPPGWVGRATRLHTPNPAEPNPDWRQGYGYQFWRSRSGYRGDGAYGQFCLVLPQQDVVLVTTAQTENMQAVLDAVWAHVLPAVGRSSPEADEALAARLSAASLVPGPGAPGPSAAPEAVADLAVYRVAREAAGGWLVTLADGEQGLTVRVGDGEWIRQEPELSHRRRLPLAAAGTSSAGTLEVQLVFLATPHRLTAVIDEETRSCSARWHTVPLHGRGLGALALPPTPLPAAPPAEVPGAG